jgi:hypothetical protein
MPGAFPAAPPTLSGDLETISRFLQSPTQLRRRLRSYVDLRFVADQVLTARYRSTGGAVLYEMSEPFVSDRTVEAVGAGSEYPYANLPTGTGAIAAVQKWGQKVILTDEEIERNIYAGAAVDRNLKKVVNGIIKQVDGIAFSAIASATSGASFFGTAAALSGAGGVAWDAAGAKILFTILKAKAAIVGLNLGYTPDTVILDDTSYALMMQDTTITNAWRRETTDNPVYTGQILQRVAGLNIIVTPNLPGAVHEVWVADSTQLGGMADEMDAAPGYATADLAVQIKSIRRDSSDSWDLQGRRKTVPIVQEPGAAFRITAVYT